MDSDEQLSWLSNMCKVVFPLFFVLPFGHFFFFRDIIHRMFWCRETQKWGWPPMSWIVVEMLCYIVWWNDGKYEDKEELRTDAQKKKLHCIKQTKINRLIGIGRVQNHFVLAIFFFYWIINLICYGLYIIYDCMMEGEWRNEAGMKGSTNTDIL